MGFVRESVLPITGTVIIAALIIGFLIILFIKPCPDEEHFRCSTPLMIVLALAVAVNHRGHIHRQCLPFICMNNIVQSSDFSRDSISLSVVGSTTY